MKKKIKSFICHVVDGMFLGTAFAYAWVEKWDLVLWYAIFGLVLITLDILGMVWEHKEETKGET